jgi:serine/threonine protein kinase
MAAGGTDGYMPPEQGAQKPDVRSDVYALGAILKDLIDIRDAQNLPSRGVRPLRSIVTRATSSDPAARYAGAGELAADVRRFADGGAVLAHRESGMERAARFGRTYRTPIVLVLTYLAARIVLLFWSGR